MEGSFLMFKEMLDWLIDAVDQASDLPEMLESTVFGLIACHLPRRQFICNSYPLLDIDEKTARKELVTLVFKLYHPLLRTPLRLRELPLSAMEQALQLIRETREEHHQCSDSFCTCKMSDENILRFAYLGWGE